MFIVTYSHPPASIHFLRYQTSGLIRTMMWIPMHLSFRSLRKAFISTSPSSNPPHAEVMCHYFWFSMLAGGKVVSEASTWPSPLILLLLHRPSLNVEVASTVTYCNPFWLAHTILEWGLYYLASIGLHLKMMEFKFLTAMVGGYR